MRNFWVNLISSAALLVLNCSNQREVSVIANTIDIRSPLKGHDNVIDLNFYTRTDGILIAVKRKPDAFKADLSFTLNSDTSAFTLFQNPQHVELLPLDSLDLRTGETFERNDPEYTYMIGHFPEVTARRVLITTTGETELCEYCLVLFLHRVPATDTTTKGYEFIVTPDN